MWEFRRDPASLSEEERLRLEALFVRLPRLRKLYELRVRFKKIFDTAPQRRAASLQLCQLELEAKDAGIDLEDFFLTYDAWQQEILNYFDDGQTSAAVEGINNKARVLIKRAYGLKSVGSLWTRLVLDLNLAKQAVGRSIERLRDLAHGLKALFRPCCT
jgi:transposase